MGQITIKDGRYEFPDTIFYSAQHVYINRDKKLLGIDEIGVKFLQNPSTIAFLAEHTAQIGEPIIAITTEQGITTLLSPCTGKIKRVNRDALKHIQTDTYSKGHMIEFDTITELDSNLITGADIEKWALAEAKSIQTQEFSFKVVEIGDSATGKTAIKIRLTDDYFKKDLQTTMGVDFGTAALNCVHSPDDLLVSGATRFIARISVWDVAGQKHYEKIRGMYYRDAKGALLVFDLNNPVSFSNLDIWVKELEENLGRKVPALLIGNKVDLERKVSKEQALAYAKNHGFQYFETSAKTGEGVREAFRNLAIEIYKREENLV